MNIIAGITIFIAFGSLCFGIGSAIGRSAERQKNEAEHKPDWAEYYEEEE